MATAMSALSMPKVAGSAAARAATPLRFAPLRSAAPKRTLVVRAEAEKPSGLAQFSASIGMPTEEGVFGFTPFAEQFVGRLSMMGFIFSIVGEATSGKGTLGQIGVSTPSTPLCVGIVSATFGAMLVATFITINDARIGKMPAAQVRRYAGVLGLKSKAVEKKEIQETQAMLRMATNEEESKPSSTAADTFLEVDGSAAADAAAAEMKSSAVAVKTAAEESAEADAAAKALKTPPAAAVSVASAADVQEEKQFVLYDEAAEMAYAKDIELSNGRWAMLGFWIAIVIEAGNGHGIILQIIDWLKYSGILGAASGF